MCLSVYIGSNNALREPENLCDGGLGLEPAGWKPEPLAAYHHVYRLGGRRGDTLGCTCLMAESVDWTRDAPCPAPDPLADIPDCPFAQLRHYLEAALQGNPHAGMVCDEEGGLVHEASEEDYEPVIVTPSLIRPLALLFHDGIGPWAMRRFTVVHDPVA